MANSTYKVKRGDNLWNISKALLSEGGSTPTNSEIQTKVNQLAAINGIANPDLIYVGQVLYLSSTGGTSEAADDDQQVAIKQFGLQAADQEGNTTNVLFVTWSWGRTNTDHYDVQWDYYTSNLIWFGGTSSTSTTKDKWHTYTIPSNATQVRVRIKPISTTKTENNKEVSHWTAKWSSWKTYAVENKPDTPGAPTVTLTGLELNAELSGIKGEPSIVKFEVTKDNATVAKSGKVNVQTGTASYTCTVTAGSLYKVRCQAYKDGVWSDWGEYSANYESAPAVPTGFTKCEAGEPATNGDPTIMLEWASITTAAKYDIEYTTTKSYFDSTNQTTTIPGIETTTWQIVTGIEPGKEYFFRIRSVNSRDEKSAWSEISSCIIGKAPAPPTTWSSTTTAIVGEPLYLYWMHNSEDGSKLTYSHVRILANGEEVLSWDIDHTKTEEETTSGSYEIDTSEYEEGTQLQWAVQTAGISKVYSDYSISRTIDIYAQPTLDLTVTNSEGSVFDELTSFPINVSAVPGPASQAPVWYHLEITSNNFYETVDNTGNAKTVNAGERIYSKHFDISTALDAVISAGDVDLENNCSYTITCTVSMNSGLIATASSEFTVAWSSAEYSPNAEIGIDPETLSAFISPYCTKYVSKNYKVEVVGNNFPKTDIVLGNVYGTAQKDIFTTTGEQVYYGTTADGENTYYCTITEAVNVEGLTLSVYRREFDGTFTKLDPDVSSSSNTFITDPHPALDYARYRIVAKSNTTGQVRYYDPPGYPVNNKCVIIQWNEAWTEFDSYGSAEEQEQPPWAGSMLKLPYNIDVSNKYSPDVSLVEYVGRKHPVSYYGTQLGESATWNVEIEKDDIETLYALRRLSIWMGDVYVREPSGSGYWANVKVSFNQKHTGLTIPVSLEVTRVEGGA